MALTNPQQKKQQGLSPAQNAGPHLPTIAPPQATRGAPPPPPPQARTMQGAPQFQTMTAGPQAQTMAATSAPNMNFANAANRSAQAPNFQAMGAVPQAQRAQGYTPTAGATRGQVMSPQIQQFANSLLQNPSRFDIDLVKQGTEVIDSELDRQGDAAMRRLEELHAKRGTLGSSPEFHDMADLQGQLEDTRAQRLYDLNMALAQTQATDRGLAGQIALQTGDFERSLGADEELANRYAAEFGRTVGRDYEDDLRARAGLQLQGGSLAESQRQFDVSSGNSYALQQRAMDLQEQGMSMDEAYRRAQLEQQDAQFGQTIGLQQRAQELQEQGMTLDEAYRRAVMEQNSEQFDQDFGLRDRALDSSIRSDVVQQLIALLPHLYGPTS